jgi:hypothetical protein
MLTINALSGTQTFALPVLRVKPGKAVDAIIQSRASFTVSTHWVDRRLWCGGENCPACDSLPQRLITYFVATVLFGPTCRTVLVESTMTQFVGWLDRAGIPHNVDLSGVSVEITRAKAKSALGFQAVGDYDKVLGTPHHEKLTVSPSLSGCFPVLASAARIAGLPCPEQAEDPNQFFARIAPAACDLLTAGMRQKGG